MAGFDPHRLAEVIVTTGRGAVRRGSGYRVATTAVLTARHVVEDAARVVLRFDADQTAGPADELGEWTCEAIDVWRCGESSDLAIVSIAPLGRPSVEVASYGAFSDRAARVRVHAAGFPRWKLRRDFRDTTPATAAEGSLYRDSHHAFGWVAVLSNRREGTLEVTVDPPAEDPDPPVSPWEGMSGAAVWVDNIIVGIVSEHHRSDGLNRLAAARLDRALEHASAEEASQLRNLIGLSSDNLRDALPPATHLLVASGYRAQIEDIAPAEGLTGREDELDELTRFCAGDEPYLWLRAEPWAGKTALMSTFALNPPAGVDLIAFFITSRLAGQADHMAFTQALIDQLAPLCGEDPATVRSIGASDTQRRRLINEAADLAARAGRKLVLLVDGLDEDRNADQTSSEPSIASLLPKRRRAGLQVIVAGRTNPPIPTDVPPDHPLRRCRVRLLEPSERARHLKEQAVEELDRVLAADSLSRDVMALLAAAGGGLTQSELEELTGQPPYRIGWLLRGAFGRTITARRAEWSQRAGVQAVYLFAHETLSTAAAEQIGVNLLSQYRGRIHNWYKQYADRGWPPNTPIYLLRSYPNLLKDQRDGIRLVQCATDWRRHDRILDHTGGDAAALTEIQIAQDLLLPQDPPPLASLARLAIRRDSVGERNANIPTTLPALWARLGQPIRAESLAFGVPNPYYRAEALMSLAVAFAAAGQDNQAESVARSISDPRRQASALAEVVKTLAAAGHRDEAIRVAESAVAAIRSSMAPAAQPWAVAGVASALAHGGIIEQAESLARAIADPFSRAPALTAVARAAAAVGRQEEARRAAEAVVADARHIGGNQYMLAEAAMLLATVGDYSQALSLVQTITDTYQQVRALTGVATSLALGGYPSLGLEVARTAGLAVVSITPSQGTCTGANAINCALGQIDHEEAATVTVVARVDTPAFSTNSGRASVSAVETDTRLGDNAATERTTIIR